MKANAAAAGVENGTHQQVVKVNRHGTQEDEPVPFPVLFVIPVGDNTYKNEVEEVMDKSLEHSGLKSFNSRFKNGSKDIILPIAGFSIRKKRRGISTEEIYHLLQGDLSTPLEVTALIWKVQIKRAEIQRIPALKC